MFSITFFIDEEDMTVPDSEGFNSSSELNPELNSSCVSVTSNYFIVIK